MRAIASERRCRSDHGQRRDRFAHGPCQRVLIDRTAGLIGDTGFAKPRSDHAERQRPLAPIVIDDAVAGNNGAVVGPLGPGDSQDVLGSATLPAGDGVFDNTATVVCDIEGFTNQVGDSASDTVIYLTLIPI